MSTLRFMFLGDLVGSPGVAMFQKWAQRLKNEHKINAIIVNGENSAKNGRGISPELVALLKESGASVITSGNHIWANKKIYAVLDENDILLRPANYPAVCPGRGYVINNVAGVEFAVINLQGRVFMHENLDCPFRTVESLLSLLRQRTKIVFVDFHAEATSEKQALASFLDGKVSGVYGTHTHVQTADEYIMPGGTSYITDLGFAGAQHSALGVDAKIIVDRFLSQMPAHFKVEKKGPMILNGIWVEVNVETGKTENIGRIAILDDEIETIL